MSIAPGLSRQFQVGTVISRSFAAFFSKILSFTGFALIGNAPSIILLGAYFYAIFAYMDFTSGATPTLPFDPETLPDSTWAWIAVGALVYVIASILLYVVWWTATSFATFQYLRNQPVRFWECLRRGIGTAPAAILAAALLVVATIVWSVAVPGLVSLLLDESTGFAGVIVVLGSVVFTLFCWVRLWILVPTIAVERPGIIAALRRSWNLTRRQFWRSFGIILLMSIVTGGISFTAWIPLLVLSLLGGAVGAILGTIVFTAVSLGSYALFAITGAVAYVELRRAKEGFGIEDIAAVFD
jgi:hypothetical protein